MMPSGRPVCHGFPQIAPRRRVSRTAQPRSAPPDAIDARYHWCMSALEIVYYALLVASALVIGWFSVFVVYRLFRGQR